jgi:hypothetical protein
MLATETKERYLADFKKARPSASAATPAWLDKLRDAGMASFQSLGFPTTRNEEWKYTNVEAIASQALFRRTVRRAPRRRGHLFARLFDTECYRLASPTASSRSFPTCKACQRCSGSGWPTIAQNDATVAWLGATRATEPGVCGVNSAF